MVTKTKLFEKTILAHSAHVNYCAYMIEGLIILNRNFKKAVYDDTETNA